MKIHFTLNGRPREFDVDPGAKLLEVLQADGVLGVRKGCDGEGSCGACAVLIDGRQMNSCLLRAAQVDGKDIRTIEFLNRHRSLSIIQSAFVDAGVVQCGYCTPSMQLAVHELIERNPDPDRSEIRDALSGTFCRCTGYQQFFDAVSLARERLSDPDFKAPPAPEFGGELRVIGKVRPKVDAPQLVRGEKAFVEDRVGADACYLKVLRSPHASAWIRSIDSSKAEAMEGVVAVFSYQNCPDIPYGCAGQGFPEPSPYDHYLFSRKMRHFGDRVAAVVAETEEIAVRALEAIEVDYDILKPVFSIEEARAPGAPLVHSGPVEYVVGAPPDLDNSKADSRDGTIIYQFPIHGDPSRNLAASVSGGIGDIKKGFAEADVIVEREYETAQVQCTPLEPHVVYTKMVAGRLVVHASTQVPWHIRRILARILGIRENQIRVIKEKTGGAFGAKQDMVVEDIAAWATWSTGRSVYYRMSRREEFMASRTRHPIKIRIKLGAKKDGKLTAMQMDVDCNTGPFGDHCLTVPMNGCSKALPLLLCDNVHFDVHSWYSNIPPTGAYQGYGAPQGSFAMQLAAAELADELGMDQMDFIEKNRVREGVVLEILRCLGEGREGSPEKVYTCALGPALERGSELIGWGRREESDDPDVKIGKGFAIIQQGSGLPHLDAANAVISMFGDGTFILLSGGTDLGTGLDTVSTKMAAEYLCTPMENISIIAADTDVTPFDVGAYASSGTYFSGGAALNAAKRMKEMILDVAQEMLAEPRENLELVYPSRVQGKSGSVGFDEIARYSQNGDGCGQLVASGVFTGENSSFPYAAHFCQVGVNTRTGEVEVQKYVALHDCGTPINPKLALGQVYGGVMKTIGHALFEEIVLDESGCCVNPTLRSYQVPMIGDVPGEFTAELIETDDPFGPYGVKSISEVACNGAAPALASAIHDATGVWIRSWPFSAEKILRALGRL